MNSFWRWIGIGSDPIDRAIDDVTVRRRIRDRRAALSTAAAVAARAVTLSVSLVAVPLTITHLGAERYGIFVALTSLTGMLIFADLGLGNGVLNLVSDANGRGDRDTARRTVSSAAFMLLAVATLLGALLLMAFPFVPWASLFPVTDPRAGSEIGPTALVLFGLFLVGLPLGLAERVRLAYQEGYINSAAVIIGTAVGFGGLILAISLDASLPVLVLALSLPPLGALGVNAYRLFRHERPWLHPRIGHVSRQLGFKLARLGGLFVVLQLAVAVAFQSDVVVAAAVLGPQEAAVYAVTLKAMMLVPTLFSVYLTALWPAYTEAIARGDGRWIRSTLRRSILAGIAVSGGASAVLVVTGPWLIGVWTNGAVDPPMLLLVGAACWAVLYAAFSAVAILFNAASVILFQVVIASAMAVVSIGLSILFAHGFGVSGIVWGTLIAYVLLAAIPTTVYAPRLLRRLEERATAGPANV